MSGIGIASFVDGFFQGKDWREAKDERTRQRERQKTQDARASEQWDWQKEDREFAASERKRAINEREADRKIWLDAYEATKSGETADAAAEPVSIRQPDTETQPVVQPDVRSRMGVIEEGAAPSVPQQMTTPRRAGVGEMPGRFKPPVPDEDVRGVQQPPAAPDRRRGASESQTVFVRDNSNVRPERGARGVIQPPQPGIERPAEAPVPPVDRQVSPRGMVAPEQPQSPAMDTPPAGDSPKAKAAEEMKSEASVAMKSTSTPAMDATAAAVKADPKGLPREITTDGQRQRASKAFIDRYMEIGAPMAVEAMLKRGQVEKAAAFQKWISEETTRKGMENWSRAAFAASIGNFDDFADEIITAYNRLDYFGDNMTIDKKKSGFDKDKTGNITGARITFKDEGTGDVFEQVFDDPTDLVRMGISLLAPEEAFEYAYKADAAAQSMRADAAMSEIKRNDDKEDWLWKEVMKKGFSQDQTKIITDTMNEMAKADMNFGTLPVEEQLARAIARVQAINEAAGSMRSVPSGATTAQTAPPVAYRPN